MDQVVRATYPPALGLYGQAGTPVAQLCCFPFSEVFLCGRMSFFLPRLVRVPGGMNHLVSLPLLKLLAVPGYFPIPLGCISLVVVTLSRSSESLKSHAESSTHDQTSSRCLSV